MLSRSLEHNILLLWRRLSSIPLALFLVLWLLIPAGGAEIKGARFNTVVGSVTTQSTAAGLRRAALNQIVGDNTTVRTGARSRTELTLANQGVARLWEKTVLNVKDAGRTLFLEDGAMFLDIPAGAELANIRGAGIAIEVAGTSAVLEYHPQVFKLLVLKGTARLYRPGHVGDSVLVTAGQLVFGNPNAALSDPVDFDLKHFLQTSRFITEFPPLRNQGSIASEIQRQEREKSRKVLMETNLVMYGGGTSVSATNRPGGKDSPTAGSTRGAGP